MAYIAKHTIIVGAPEQRDKDGNISSKSSLRSIAAGQPLPDMDAAEIDRLLSSGAIAEMDSGNLSDRENSRRKPIKG